MWTTQWILRYGLCLSIHIQMDRIFPMLSGSHQAPTYSPTNCITLISDTMDLFYLCRTLCKWNHVVYTLCVWLLLFNIMFIKCIHIAVYHCSIYSTWCFYTTYLFILMLISYLGSFHFGAIMNSAAKNVTVSY